MVVLGDLCCDSLVGFIGSKLSLQRDFIPKTKGLSLEYRGLKLYQCMCVCVCLDVRVQCHALVCACGMPAEMCKCMLFSACHGL